jgi:hypothetical protein
MFGLVGPSRRRGPRTAAGDGAVVRGAGVGTGACSAWWFRAAILAARLVSRSGLGRDGVRLRRSWRSWWGAVWLVLGIPGGMAGPAGPGLLVDGWLKGWESRLAGFGRSEPQLVFPMPRRQVQSRGWLANRLAKAHLATALVTRLTSVTISCEAKHRLLHCVVGWPHPAPPTHPRLDRIAQTEDASAHAAHPMSPAALPQAARQARDRDGHLLK